VLLDPSCAPAWNDLGVILEALGNRRDAVHCYRQAIRAQPGMEEPRRNLLALAAQAALRASLPAPVRGRAALAVAR
jgi:Flp pilus assembly protein TadD